MYKTIQYNSPAKFGNNIEQRKDTETCYAWSITNLLTLHDNGLSKQKSI